MPTVEYLTEQIQILQRSLLVAPPSNPFELNRRQLEIEIIRLQKEAETFRNAHRNAFLLTKPRIVEKEENGIITQTVKTFFNWEPVRDLYLKSIDDKEQRGIAYFKNQIQELYKEESQSTNPNQ